MPPAKSRRVESDGSVLSFALSKPVHAKCDQVSARQPCIAKQLRTSCLRTEIADPSAELKPLLWPAKTFAQPLGLLLCLCRRRRCILLVQTQRSFPVEPGPS